MRLSAATSFFAPALAAASFFFAVPTAFFAAVVAFFAVFFADFTALPARLVTLPPTFFAVSARASAALVRVVATPLPLLMVLPRQVCCGRGARTRNVARSGRRVCIPRTRAGTGQNLP